MKNLLPEVFKNTSGFTLVELMVAIAIIAIMATIGIVIFSNAQVQARDSKRRADIDAIANAIEKNRNAGSTSYNGWITSADFAGGSIPTDPKSWDYCYNVTGALNSAPPAAATAANWNNNHNCTGSYSTVNATAPGSTVYVWTVCALLEQNSVVYCRSNQQ